jgi:hypothetical protein
MHRSVLALGLVFAFACGGESPTEPPVIANLAGTWNLTTVNAAALPVKLPGTGPDLTVEMMSDRFIAYGDKIWIGTTIYRRTNSDGIAMVTQVPSGTWNQTGANVTLNYFGGATAQATIAGDAITFTAPGWIAVYERE